MLAAVALAAAVVSFAGHARAQAHDPRLTFETLETPHFRLNYQRGLRREAQRIASVGEGIYDAVGTLMGWHPHQRVEIMLTDDTDDGNGFATVVPFNQIHLFIAAPEDLSELGDYDDYLQQLLTHEFTHITHMDNISGIPALIDAIFGKIYPPNAAEPSWILEGIAVYSETRNTTGGRLRSSYWNMLLRGDALADRFVTLDQLSSGPPERWPHGDIIYLYGSYFIDYIVHRFGEHVLADISTYYGGQLIPGAINRAVQRATGFTYEQLWRDFIAELRRRYREEQQGVEARGLREGERLTTQGEYAFYPRFLSDGHTVAFESGDGHSHNQIRTIDAGQVGGPIARAQDGDWIDALSGFSLTSNGRRLFVSDTGFYREIYFFRDLYERSASLDTHGRLHTRGNHNITDGGRAMYPDVSPDDDHLAYAVNHHGTSALWERTLSTGEQRPLLRVQRYDQVYTPRYSPDGTQIVFSQWRRGGFRDIRIVDRATGAVRDLTHDRAIDMEPVFTPDGRYVVFSSDRTGIFNLYAYELATGTLRQVTNVRTGAFMPAISPDGRTLVYTGYSTWGFDLYRMPFDPDSWLDPGPERTRDGTTIATPPYVGRTHPYNPWPTFRPHYWGLDLTDDGFGYQAGVDIAGSDIAGIHAYAARFAIGLVRGDPNFDITYFYNGLRPTLRVHGYRNVTAGSMHIGTHDVTLPIERSGGEAELSVSFPALFMRNDLSFDYEAQMVRVLGAIPWDRYVDPNEDPTLPPFQGWIAGIRGTWSFSRVQRYTYDISASEGYEGLLTVHGTDPALGSSDRSFDAAFAATGYIGMPWGWGNHRHVLALRAAGGAGIIDNGARGIFSIGGFPTYGFGDFINSFLTLSASSGVALRGYNMFARTGNTFYLLNAEYRFLIVQIDRGASTLPVYISRLYGALVTDVGNAYFGPFRIEDVAVGVGAEALIDFVVGWYFPYTLRIGVAQGLTGTDGTFQVYALLSAPF